MSNKNRQKTVYLDPVQPVEKRVDDLLGRMTLDEKIAQMNMCHMNRVMDGNNKFVPSMADKFIAGVGIGVMRMLNGTTHTISAEPKEKSVEVNKIQRYVTKSSRHKIPALFVAECLHGYVAVGATVFPQSIGLASSWDPGLVEKIATVTACEARSTGVHQALSPMLDITHEPRWARTEESYGEDPYLASRMGVAFIKGLQGEGPGIDSEHIAATVKHFAAHGRPETGLNLSPVAVGEREFRQIFLPPYEAGVREGKALSVMPAYHEIDGVPCHASKRLLQKILREEWGFEGYTISDFIGIRQLCTLHNTAESLEEAGRQALEAGVDLEAPEIECYGPKFKKLVEQGKISEKLVDKAAGRILRVKFLLGLFDGRQFADPKLAKETCDSQAHRKLALEAARQSLVLLKNEKDLLPLKKNLRSIAVIGPSADAVRLGGYSGVNKNIVTVLDGIKNILSSRVKINYARGCDMYQQSTEGITGAVEAAKKSDVAIVVLGEGREISCEGRDRADLDLPGVQQQLIEAVHAAGVPTVAILLNGRPLAVEWIAENVPAIIQGWYLGEEGGTALAEALFGDCNPGGKLPITFPRSTGHIPSYYNHKPSARGAYGEPGSPEKPGMDFALTTPAPLFEFGYGLSYTTFKYSNLRVAPNKIFPNGKVTVNVDVQNSGKRKGAEVVQMYITDEISSVTTPVKELKGFEKITLKPGEKKTVTFMLDSSALSLIDINMNKVVEPGAFQVMIGGMVKRFTVLGPGGGGKVSSKNIKLKNEDGL
jgi:beta-xylosidase